MPYNRGDAMHKPISLLSAAPRESFRMNAPKRRGVCPGLSTPLATGDGLLVRLRLSDHVTLDAFAELCAAARRCGNGIIEVTARGSIQIRGLRSDTVTTFADTMAEIEIAADEAVVVMVDPLAGLDADAGIAAAGLAEALRGALTNGSPASAVGPKVSVGIDGGEALNLDALTADVRVRVVKTESCVRSHIAVAGDAGSAIAIGVAGSGHEVEAVLRLLAVIAAQGPHARARDVVRDKGVEPFRAAVQGLVTEALPLPARQGREPLGMHLLRTGRAACGVALAFGHAQAGALETLIAYAGRAGAGTVRTAPGRTLLFVGFAEEDATAFMDAAEAEEFIVHPDDPRRRVVACAGAPMCDAGEIPARTLAPSIAAAAGPLLDGSVTIHISGCQKGCAHSAAANLAIVGAPRDCGLIVNGRAGDRPVARIAKDALPATVAELATRMARVRQPGEAAAEAFVRVAEQRSGSRQPLHG
jgi:precorrin-3B synthase